MNDTPRPQPRVRSRSRGSGSHPLLAFDLMDTVVVDPFFAEVPRLFEGSLEGLAVERDRTAWPAFERNEIDEATFMRRFYRDGAPAGLPSAERVRQAIVENYRFVAGVPALLHRLRLAGLELWVFSNYPVWFELVRQRLDLNRYFDGFVVSFQTGARKPDASAYRAFCSAAARAPHECLLIDDRQVNVDGARAAGMDAVRFSGVEQLSLDLARRLGT